jgi:hypothetical protein
VGLGGRQDPADSSSFFQDLSGSGGDADGASGRGHDIPPPVPSSTSKGRNHQGMLHVVA